VFGGNGTISASRGGTPAYTIHGLQATNMAGTATNLDAGTYALTGKLLKTDVINLVIIVVTRLLS